MLLLFTDTQRCFPFQALDVIAEIRHAEQADAAEAHSTKKYVFLVNRSTVQAVPVADRKVCVGKSE